MNKNKNFCSISPNIFIETFFKYDLLFKNRQENAFEFIRNLFDDLSRENNVSKNTKHEYKHFESNKYDTKQIGI